MLQHKMKVLFLCTGNSCRSQMDEDRERHLKGDVIEPYSAGIERHGLNPHAVKVLAEAGVDMTEEMVEAARRHAAEAGHRNITIHHGQIELLPVDDASVDVVISNCVVNLSPDQPTVWREVFRVLRPGGRVAISDIVATQPLPEQLKDRPDLLCGCVSGAAARDDLKRWRNEIGFEAVRLEPREAHGRSISQWLPDDTSGAEVISTMIHARKPVV